MSKSNNPATGARFSVIETNGNVRHQPSGIETLSHSLCEVMKLISPIIDSTLEDAAIAQVMLTKNLYVEPLTWHEYTVLACALYYEHRCSNEGFDYGSIVELSDRFQGKPMNTTMIYKTMVALQEKGLIASVGKERSFRGRAADHFVVTNNGRGAFRMATLNALHLGDSLAA